MNKHLIISIFLLLFPMIIRSQIGIGTTKPHEKASVHLAEEDKALILNSVNDKENLTNPHKGMIFYDVAEECFRGYANGVYTDCFGTKPSDPVVRVDGTGFKGTMVRGEQLTNVTYEITVTNNTFKTVDLGFHVSDLTITDTAGNILSTDIEVTSVYLSGNYIANNKQLNHKFVAGASVTIVYELSGTPNAPYTQILGEWSKITMMYDDIIDVTYTYDCPLGNWTDATLTKDNFLLKNSQNYDIIFESPIPNSEGFEFEALQLTKSGLTLTRALTQGAANGVLVYKIKGVYSGPDAQALDFGIINGCNFEVGRYPESCLEILNLQKQDYFKIYDADNQKDSGKYKIDVDGLGGLKNMDCYCDMDTDGGGWTLVLNYNRKEATNPDLDPRSDSLPILNRVGLFQNGDTDEADTEYWGHAEETILEKINFTSVRFYGLKDRPTGKDAAVHFKNSNSTVVDGFKGLNPNMIGLNSNSVDLPIDTTTQSLSTVLPHKAVLNLPAHPFTWSYFAKGGTNHWSIKGRADSGIFCRWEMDDNTYYTATPTNTLSTVHRIWVK